MPVTLFVSPSLTTAHSVYSAHFAGERIKCGAELNVVWVHIHESDLK